MKFCVTFLCLNCLIYQAILVRPDTGLVLIEEESESDKGEVTISEEESELFEATNEWKEVDANQVLPKGLHVRINIETGKKEAKLLESSAEVDVHSRITSNYQVIAKDGRKSVVDNMESIRKLNDLKAISKSNSIKHKSIDEIKQANNVRFTSESVLLKETLDKYAKEKDEKSRLAQLADMEYYVHSIDLANDFFNSGGFSILLNDLNQTNSIDLKLSILGVIGASVQSNPSLKSQLLASVDFLRQIVVLTSNSEDVSLLKKCLFVLGAFVRNFQPAFSAFLRSYNGVEVLESLLSKDLALATRTFTLLSDLAIEMSTAATLKGSDASTEYEEAQFAVAIKSSHICPKLVEIMADLRDRSALISMFESMAGLMTLCQDHFQENAALLQTIASQLNLTDGNSDFQSITGLLGRLNLKDEL